MKPQIDTTKPIQMSCADRGGNAIGLWFDVVLIHMTDKHAYGYTADTNEQMSQVWKFTEWKFRNKPGEPSDLKDTHMEQQEIDWNGELQILSTNDPNYGWTDFTPVWRNDICVIGWITEDGPENAYSWSLAEFRFRIKPAEPKRVRGFVNIYSATLHKDKANANLFADSSRIACIEIDVPEGHGLEE